MKASEFREMGVGELQEKVTSLEENLFRMRCNKAVGQLTDTSALPAAKRDVARAKTILKEKLASQ